MIFIYCFAGFVALSVTGICIGICRSKESKSPFNFGTGLKIHGKIKRIKDHHFDKNPEGKMRFYDK